MTAAVAENDLAPDLFAGPGRLNVPQSTAARLTSDRVPSAIAPADRSRGSNCDWTGPAAARDDPASARAQRAIAAPANRKDPRP